MKSAPEDTMDLWSVPHCRWLPNPEVKHLRLLLLRLAELSGSFHSMWIGGVPTTEDLPLPGQIAEQETCSFGNCLPGLVSDMPGESNRKKGSHLKSWGGCIQFAN